MALSLHLYFTSVLLCKSLHIIVCKGEKNLLLLLCAAFDLAYERMCFESSNVVLKVSGVLGNIRFIAGPDDVKDLFQIIL